MQYKSNLITENYVKIIERHPDRTKALETCPACLHPKSFMQIREENY